VVAGHILGFFLDAQEPVLIRPVLRATARSAKVMFSDEKLSRQELMNNAG
jgi:hypothetical protein